MTAGGALRAAAVLLAVAAVLLALAVLAQRRLIYLPSADAGAPPAGVQEAVLHTEDGLALGAWWVAPAAPGRGRAVLVLPGNAGDRSLRLPLGRALAAEGFGVLLLDYRGYGGNPGSPSEEGLAADARAAHRYLAERRDAPAPVVFGESLGAAVAVRLATERPVSALVLRSPFVSLAEVAAEHYPLPAALARVLLRDRFPVAEHAAGTSVPVTVVLGDRDAIVPPAQSRAVAAAASAELVVVAGAGHNDAALNTGPAVVDAVVRAAG